MREIRARLEQQHAVEQIRRRAEDFFREEHHDAHATILKATSSPRSVRRMRVRIVATLPASVIDGFEIQRLRPERVYNVAEPIGRFLVAAGYAVRVGDGSA